MVALMSDVCQKHQEEEEDILDLGFGREVGSSSRLLSYL